jgi:hypothetical protein
MVSEPRGDYPTYLERLLASPSLQGPDFPYFDAVSFHSYPDSYPGRRPFDEPFAYIRRSLAARGIERPVWLTEFGCEGLPGHEEGQAARLVQWALCARAMDIQRVYIYCLCDHHWATGAAEYLGLVGEGLRGESNWRKPAFEGVRALVRELSQRPEVTRQDDNVYVLRGGKGDLAYAVWRDGADAQEPRFLTSSWWEVRALDGSTARRQGTQVELTAMPIFVQRARSPFLDKTPMLLHDDSLLPLGPALEHKEKETDKPNL